jgi:hypothetical protein
VDVHPLIQWSPNLLAAGIIFVSIYAWAFEPGHEH